MKEYRVLTKDVKGRFAWLREGQVISDENLTLAGHDVSTLVQEGRVEPIKADATPSTEVPPVTPVTEIVPQGEENVPEVNEAPAARPRRRTRK